MCARFTLAIPDFALLAALLRVDAGDIDPEIAAGYRPRYNIAPSNGHLVLSAQKGKRALALATWGFVNRQARDGGPARLVNARSESARTRPAFREAFATRRCVVPADGFYEWSGAKSARRPTWFHPARGGLLHLAGLYEPANSASGQIDWAFTILTTDANAEVASVHDRMPALLTEQNEIDAWLDGASANPEQAEALLRPAAAGVLALRRVSPRVNSVAHDDPTLLCEVAAEPGGTLPLFGGVDVGRAPTERHRRR